MQKFTLLFCFIFIAAACSNKINSENYYSHQILINDRKLMVQIVSSPREGEKGLSGRNFMKEDQGMLFDFGPGEKAIHTFWMKDMKFNLDLIWIADNKIIGITPDVSKPSGAEADLPRFYPPSPVDKVLEVNAGWAAKNNIQIGDEVKSVKKSNWSDLWKFFLRAQSTG